MPKHIHADLMMQYAKDAMETDKPWERWEIYNDSNDRWEQLKCQAFFTGKYQYRRKVPTISINGFEVPEPLRFKPLLGSKYYYAEVSNQDSPCKEVWTGCNFDIMVLNNGLVHLTREAAIAHAKALLSFTEIKE